MQVAGVVGAVWEDLGVDVNVMDFKPPMEGDLIDLREVLPQAMKVVGAAGGGSVYLPPGEYLGPERLAPPRAVVVRGAGLPKRP